MAGIPQFLTVLLDFLLPPVCHICRSHISEPQHLHICPTCLEALTPVTSPCCPLCGVPFHANGTDHLCGNCILHPPHFDTAHAPYLYEGALRDLIHSFKYDHRMQRRQVLTLLMLTGTAPLLRCQSPDLIVPIPLHVSRLRERGFNQAALLGAQAARLLALPIALTALARVRSTVPQIELAAHERQVNVKDAFAVTQPVLIHGKNILLVDDVITTGSTMNECARILKKAGAAQVTALAIARAAH